MKGAESMAIIEFNGGGGASGNSSLRGIEPIGKSAKTIKSAESATMDNMPQAPASHTAFTLAEVLITIGVIGIVAAMTLPALINNIGTYVKNKRVENIQQKFSKATDKMLALDGMNGYGSTANFVNTLKKHLKIAQICDNSHIRNCWPYDTVILDNGKEWDISKTTTGKTLKMTDDEFNEWDSTVGIVTADGTPMILSYNKKCDMTPDTVPSWSESKSSSTNCVAAVYDWNGIRKNNTFGMSLTSDNDVLPLNANGLGSACAIEVGSLCFGSFFQPEPLTTTQCAELKAKGLLDYYYYNNDYWAGAVKQCGGKSNMPTLSDLNNLYNELKKGDYATNTAALGLPDYALYVWSGQEYSGSIADERNFDPSYSYENINYRNLSGYWAVCLQ